MAVILGLLVVSATAQAKKPITKQGIVKTPAIASVPAKCAGNGLTQAEATEILVAHNRARAEVHLAPLKWDCTLAATAQAWASKGVAGHNDGTNFGENVFVSATDTEQVTSATTRWMGEKANWSNKGGACSAGKTCTHYTQMVWKATHVLGCGINRNGSEKWKVILVCNYDPMAMTGPAY
ncbi:MAG TPA: CAP domain-containing protein [Pyrinomonadaceae bacterium]|nr:CAP domain-containing protein [Pyrinomonadaceae bacterium]